jgi:Fe-S-cluster containining protein
MIDRETLLKNMFQLSNQGIDCLSCNGRCCTFERNSMKITRAEAEELYHYLLDNDLFNSKLERKLQDCIREYRLDVEISTKKDHAFRRTYTCPFFVEDSKRCSIPPEVKPLGCLAYNPSEKRSLGESCSSDEQLLEKPTLMANMPNPKAPKWSIPQYLLLLRQEGTKSGATLSLGPELKH